MAHAPSQAQGPKLGSERGELGSDSVRGRIFTSILSSNCTKPTHRPAQNQEGTNRCFRDEPEVFLDEPVIALIGDEQETQLAMSQSSVNVSRGQRKLEEGRREALNNSIVREFPPGAEDTGPRAKPP